MTNLPPTGPATGSRREFLKTSGTVLATSALAANAALARSVHPGGFDTIKIGLVGCGGRGNGAAANALSSDKNLLLTAMGDVFPDAIERGLVQLQREGAIREKVDVAPDNRFVGLDAYQKVIDSGVDVVLLCTPPGFRPKHLAAAIAANKHVFCEKPMATDAPGVRSVLESAARAKEKNLAIVAGFCWRYNYARREIFQRIHDGEIGPTRTIYATYYTGPVKPMQPAGARRPEHTDLEWQIRNWYNFTWLSGDGLVEQAVHSVDKVAWAMKDVPPAKAVAVGGRQLPNHDGNIFDHFEVNYEWADGTRAFMGCRQIPRCWNQNADYIIGARGTGQIGVGSRRANTVEIIGENPWRYGGPDNDMYRTEHEELYASIRAGKPINDGTWMSTSTMMAIMGRMAAYTGQEITWDMAINSKEQLVPDRLEWNMKLDLPKMAMPGVTEFV
jgi:predicted dehydrogenase